MAESNIMRVDEYWASQVNHWRHELAECNDDPLTVARLLRYLDHAKSNLRAVAFHPASPASTEAD